MFSSNPQFIFGQEKWVDAYTVILMVSFSVVVTYNIWHPLSVKYFYFCLLYHVISPNLIFSSYFWCIYKCFGVETTLFQVSLIQGYIMLQVITVSKEDL